MNRYRIQTVTAIDFVAAFLLLAGLVAAVTLSLRAESGKHAEQGGIARKISLEEFEKLRADKKHTVLDVRTAREFAAGRVPGATNIDVNSADFDTKVAALDKQKPYLIHCAAGVRSAKAVRRMREMGFKELYDFSGGWTVWKGAGKPAER